MGRDIAKLARELSTGSADTFLAAYPDPFLVCYHMPQERGTQSPFSYQIDHTEMRVAALEAEGLEERLGFYAVKKQGMDQLSINGVSVGRARNCDIAIQSKTVSKLHGFLRQNEGGYEIIDHNSTNGTYINKKKIPIQTWTRVKENDTITFGTVEMQFLIGESLIEFLRNYQESL